MANPNPSPSTRFKPGHSGGPGGPGKGRRATSELLKLIEERGADRAIAVKWLQEILQGDFRYFQAFLDRTEGKVTDLPDHKPEISALADAMRKAHEAALTADEPEIAGG